MEKKIFFLIKMIFYIKDKMPFFLSILTFLNFDSYFA